MRLANLIKQEHDIIREELEKENMEINEDCLPKVKSGKISAADLHKHMDMNDDGKVDIVDFAAAVLFHVENPQHLKPYMEAARERLIDSSRKEYETPDLEKNTATASLVGRRKY